MLKILSTVSLPLSTIFGLIGLYIIIVNIGKESLDKITIKRLSRDAAKLSDKIIEKNNLIENRSNELSTIKQKHKELKIVSDFRQMTIAKLVDTNCNLVIESDAFEKDNIRLQTLVDNLKNEIGYQSNMLEKRDDTIDNLIRQNIDKDNLIEKYKEKYII